MRCMEPPLADCAQACSTKEMSPRQGDQKAEKDPGTGWSPGTLNPRERAGGTIGIIHS